MDELLLINMMSELDPIFLQNDYIEKDMKKGIIHFLKNLFSFKKLTRQENNSLEQIIYEDSIPQREINSDLFEDIKTELFAESERSSEEGSWIQVAPEAEDRIDYNNDNRGFDINVFKSNVSNLIKIISGIAAAFVVVISILFIIIKKHKSGLKLYKKKVEVIL